MSMLDKIKSALTRFMTGRHGVDELSMALLICGVVLSILSSVTRLGLFYMVGMACYFASIFRLFSRNHVRRTAENERFKSLWNKISGSATQFVNRMKNIRKYKYFKCPECHARLRLPRKVGEVTVTCGKCRHAFKQKA